MHAQVLWIPRWSRQHRSPNALSGCSAIQASDRVWFSDCVCKCLASVIVQDIQCFGYRNPTLETFSPSSQSSAVASPGPDDACAQSTSPLCCAVISRKGWEQTKIGRVSALSHTRIYSPFPLWTLALRHYSSKHHHNQQQPLHHHKPFLGRVGRRVWADLPKWLCSNMK